MFLENKYSKFYFDIINKAKSQNRIKLNRSNINYVYYEKHHILPKSLFPELATSKDNLVLLTAREHFICHLLLVKMTTGINKNRMMSAVTRFQQVCRNQKNYRNFNSYEYAKIREYSISARLGTKHTLKSKQKIKDNHHNVSGKNNPRAKHIIAIDPNGNIFNLVGNLKSFCKEHNLGYSTVHLILSHGKRFKGSTYGWEFKYP